MPTPRANEGERAFTDRCMADPTMTGEYPDTAQRRAVCGSIYRRRSLSMHDPRYLLSTEGKLSSWQLADQQQRRYDKEALRVGTYKHPTAGWTLHVDQDRLDRMVQTFNRMKQAGVTSDVTVDHSQSARDKVGEIVGARRDGDRLILTHQFADEEGEKLARRAPEVSVEIEPELVDGQANTYRDALVASSIVRQPVVPGQSGFAKVAASRDDAGQASGTAVALPFRLSADSSTANDQTPGTTGDMTMQLTEEQRKQARKLTGLGEDAGDDQLQSKLTELALNKGLAPDEEQVSKSEFEKVQNQLNETKQELEKHKPHQPSETEKQLQNQLDETEAENAESKAKQLVAAGRMSADASTKLLNLLAGQQGARKRMTLSRGQNGEPSLARQVLDILEQDQTTAKTDTQHAALQLAREVPDGGNESAPDSWVDEELKSANGQGK